MKTYDCHKDGKAGPLRRRISAHATNTSQLKLSDDLNAFYERHLTFDQVVPNTSATVRDNSGAIARPARDVLSQRWLKTEQTYQRRKANPLTASR